MIEKDLIRLLSRGPEETFQHFVQMKKSERRKMGPQMLRVNRQQWSRFMKTGEYSGDLFGALDVALMACCNLSQLKKLRNQPLLFENTVKILKAFEIEFVKEWIDLLLETDQGCVTSEVWDAGLCPRPTSDAFIMSYYRGGGFYHRNGDNGIREDFDDIFFEQEVWRFFEVEGAGSSSLAAHDTYSTEDCSWQTWFIECSELGKLDRDRLLDASLQALSLDFAQFRAGWYSRFHEALKPTLDERIDRTERYVELLASTNPPTVGLAVKALKLICKSQPVALDILLPALERALEARQKSTVTGALQILGYAAKTAPHLSEEIACTACHALVSEDSAVQERAIKLIEKLGMLGSANVDAKLSDYIPYLSPANRARFTTLDVETIETPIVRNSPLPIVPVANAEETLAIFLELLEDSSDPFKVERAFDGVARFGAELAADKKAMSPLKKRANQLSKEKRNVDFIVLAAHMWVETADEHEVLAHHETESIVRYRGYNFHERNRSVLSLVKAGHALPMLSLPTDTAGFIDPKALLERLMVFRDAGVAPAEQDLDVALLRLSPNNVVQVLEGFTPETLAEQNFAFALGADPVFDPSTLATSAHDARLIRAAHVSEPSAAKLTFDLTLFADENDIWFEPSQEENDFSRMYAAANKHKSSSWLHTSKGTSLWHSILCPGFMESYFQSVLIYYPNYYWHEPNPKFLEVFFRPGNDIGPLGAILLASYLGGTEKETRSTAAEVVIALLDEGRLETHLFIEAFNTVFFVFDCPVKRFAESLSIIAESGRRGSEFACNVIEGTMTFPSDKAPRNYGALLELLHGQRLLYPSVLSDKNYQFLQSLKSGGKTAEFAKKLCLQHTA